MCLRSVKNDFCELYDHFRRGMVLLPVRHMTSAASMYFVEVNLWLMELDGEFLESCHKGDFDAAS